MRKLIGFTLLLALCATCMAGTLYLPLTQQACNPGGHFAVYPYLSATWGPGNGSACRVNGWLYAPYYVGCDAGGCHYWGCIDSITLEDYTELPNHACDCYDDWNAKVAIAIDPNTCTPQGDQFNETYYCS